MNTKPAIINLENLLQKRQQKVIQKIPERIQPGESTRVTPTIEYETHVQPIMQDRSNRWRR